MSSKVGTWPQGGTHGRPCGLSFPFPLEATGRTGQNEIFISFPHSPEKDLKIPYQEVPVDIDLSHHAGEEHAQEEEGKDKSRHGHEHDPSLEQR